MAKRLFSPLKQKPSWNIEEFSVRLLEKEIELERNCRLDIIEDLITLYSEAIEHYSEVNDQRFYDFQDRMHVLLMRPEVSAVVNGKGLQNLYNLAKRKNISTETEVKSKILEKEPVSLGNSESEPLNIKEEILQNMSKQETNLELRISQRKNKQKACNLNDISTKGSYYVDEKDQIESTMEKYYTKKAKEISEITVFYLMKMESADESYKSRLAEEMKKEILNISKKHDDLRNNQLKKLRKGFSLF